MQRIPKAIVDLPLKSDNRFWGDTVTNKNPIEAVLEEASAIIVGFEAYEHADDPHLRSVLLDLAQISVCRLDRVLASIASGKDGNQTLE